MSGEWDDDDYEDEDELELDEDTETIDEDIVEDLEPGTTPFNQAYYALNMAQGMMKVMMQQMQYMKHDLVDAHNWHISKEQFKGSVEAGLESLNIRDNKLPNLKDIKGEATSKPNKTSEEK